MLTSSLRLVSGMSWLHRGAVIEGIGEAVDKGWLEHDDGPRPRPSGLPQGFPRMGGASRDRRIRGAPGLKTERLLGSVRVTAYNL